MGKLTGFKEFDLVVLRCLAFWCYYSLLVLDAYRKRVKDGFRDRRNTLDDVEFVSTLELLL